MAVCLSSKLGPETEVPIYIIGKLFLTHKMTICGYSHFIYVIINRDNVFHSQDTEF